MTLPACPCFVKIIRVDEIFKPIRKSVVIKRSEGKIENSSGSLIFIVISRMISETDIFMMKNISNINGFNGITNNNTITITNNEIALLRIFFMIASPPVKISKP